MSDKHYETSERGSLDLGDGPREPKPCSKRIAHGHELATSPVTWCTQPDEHAGACSGPIPWPMALEPRARNR
jgi:hypothetical protein